jgi:hypothetical protein
MACLLIASLFILCGCSHEPVFTELKNGNVVSPDGVEYTLIGTEPEVYYLGTLTFEAGVKGEETYNHRLGKPSRNGMYSIAESATDDILIRKLPDSEWYSVYRKATRPPLDLSPERCVRLELFSSANPDLLAVDHANCADGIRDPEVIAEFFSDVRKQKSPEEAELYDMIRKPDGYLDNCYSYGVVFAFFEDEPDLVLPLFLTSFNDLAYSVSIEGKSYVLPEEWLDLLIATSNVG